MMIERFVKQSLLLGGTALAGVGAVAAPGAQANTLVATIYGVYDASTCGNSPSSCLSPPSGEPLATGYMNNAAGAPYGSNDTPSLYFNNNTGFVFTNVKVVLQSYQGLNLGSTTTVPAVQLNGGTIGADTVYQLIWNQVGGNYGNTYPTNPPVTTANLYSYDYDDYYSNTIGNTYAGCAAEGYSYCAPVGNFKVTFTAMWDGVPIFSQFSPSSNLTGGFVGWEGIDQNGWSETTADNHQGTTAGVLANIYVGTPTVPEPSTWAMMLAGFAGLGYLGYRKTATAGSVA
jgi:PEP-CTERM motif